MMVNLSDSQNCPDRLGTIGAILAAGLLRALARKSSHLLPEGVKTSLDCEPSCGGDVGKNSQDIAP